MQAYRSHSAGVVLSLAGVMAMGVVLLAAGCRSPGGAAASEGPWRVRVGQVGLSDTNLAAVYVVDRDRNFGWKWIKVNPVGRRLFFGTTEDSTNNAVFVQQLAPGDYELNLGVAYRVTDYQRNATLSADESLSAVFTVRPGQVAMFALDSSAVDNSAGRYTPPKLSPDKLGFTLLKKPIP